MHSGVVPRSCDTIDASHQVKRKEEAYNKGKYVLDQQVAGSKSRTQDEERRLESQNGTVENLDRVAAENKASTDVLRVQIEVSACVWTFLFLLCVCVCRRFFLYGCMWAYFCVGVYV